MHGPTFLEVSTFLYTVCDRPALGKLSAGALWAQISMAWKLF